MNLSLNFTLAEMTSSDTARRIGDANQPGPVEIQAMLALCRNILEPIRAHFGRPVRINSGYRSDRVNAAVGSKPGSQHRRGEASDIEIEGVANAELARWIVSSTLPFDQVILEAYRPGVPGSGWVHVSHRSNAANRRNALTMTMGSHGPVYSAGINA